MENQKPPTLIEHFSTITDPRIDRTKRHKLIDILVIAICAIICGAESWDDFEVFGEAKEEWFPPRSSPMALPRWPHVRACPARDGRLAGIRIPVNTFIRTASY
jgi:hypothetical protein